MPCHSIEGACRNIPCYASTPFNQSAVSVKTVCFLSTVNLFVTRLAKKHQIVESIRDIGIRAVLLGQMNLVMHNATGIQYAHCRAPFADAAN